MLGLTALRNLVALTEKLQCPLVEEKGKVCIPTLSPPAYKPERDDPTVAQAAADQSASPPVAPRATPGASMDGVAHDRGEPA